MSENGIHRPHAQWLELAGLALRGLERTYGDCQRLPHTMLWNGSTARPDGFNVRYALISVLGLAKARSLDLPVSGLIDSLWNRVCALQAVELSPGDHGLRLWARALIDDFDEAAPREALRSFRGRREVLDSVELAWLVLGCDHLLMSRPDAVAEELLREAKDDLLALHNAASGLFFRHSRAGVIHRVSRRVPCFANQIYPVMALAVHHGRTGCTQSAEVGRAAAETICRLQGPLGQWWWLYDAQDGGVVDGYPVFSVHQDGMAPMALMETTLAGGRSFESEIEKSLAWIRGHNELAAQMIQTETSLVWRDIHKKGVGRIQRAMRSAAWCFGLTSRPDEIAPANFVINHECRPYHLGWILYAASLVSGRAPSVDSHAEAGAIACS